MLNECPHCGGDDIVRQKEYRCCDCEEEWDVGEMEVLMANKNYVTREELIELAKDMWHLLTSKANMRAQTVDEVVSKGGDIMERLAK